MNNNRRLIIKKMCSIIWNLIVDLYFFYSSSLSNFFQEYYYSNKNLNLSFCINQQELLHEIPIQQSKILIPPIYHNLVINFNF